MRIPRGRHRSAAPLHHCPRSHEAFWSTTSSPIVHITNDDPNYRLIFSTSTHAPNQHDPIETTRSASASERRFPVLSAMEASGLARPRSLGVHLDSSGGRIRWPCIAMQAREHLCATPMLSKVGNSILHGGNGVCYCSISTVGFLDRRYSFLSSPITTVFASSFLPCWKELISFAQSLVQGYTRLSHVHIVRITKS